MLPFAFAPHIVEHPRIAAIGLVALAITSVLSVLPPMRRWRPVKRNALAIAMLLAFATTLSFATGRAHSPLLVLYLLPLAATGGAVGRPVLVFGCGMLVALFGGGLAAVTPDTPPRVHEFAVLLFSMLLPALRVALALAHYAQRLHTLAGSDPLTGLMNFRAFNEVLQRRHRRAEREGLPYSIVMVDVNDTAAINESLGHNAGDQLILAVAQAISRSVRATDAAARLSGDTFVVLLADLDARSAAQVAQRMRNHVYQGTILIGNRLLRASVSIGTAHYPEDHLQPKELMKMADQRMRADQAARYEHESA